MSDAQKSGWQIEKKLPVALIITMVAQAVAVGIWVGSIDSRLTSTELSVADTKAISQRWFDENKIIEHRLTRIETLLERLLLLQDKR